MENNESEQKDTNPKAAEIQVGITPYGNIALNVTDDQGNNVQTTISLEEAERLSSRLQSLAAFLLHISYLEMAQRQAETVDIASKLGVNSKPHLF